MIDSADADDEIKSKSQIKREFKAFQDLGKQLVELPKKQLDNIPLSEAMRELIVTAQSLKHGVLNRQIRLIGRRMPEENIESIQQTLAKLQRPHKQAVGELHELEQWRDRLLRGDQTAFDELANKHTDFDRQHASQLIRNAKKELDAGKPPKSSRLLFKYLTVIKSSN
jgi:ribosome-associated protein